MQGKNKPKIIDFGLIKAIVFICFCDDVRIKKMDGFKNGERAGIARDYCPSSSRRSDHLTASTPLSLRERTQGWVQIRPQS